MWISFLRSLRLGFLIYNLGEELYTCIYTAFLYVNGIYFHVWMYMWMVRCACMCGAVSDLFWHFNMCSILKIKCFLKHMVKSMCITHLIIISEMLFFSCPFYIVETEARRSCFFSRVMRTVGRWPRLVHRPLIPDQRFSSVPRLPGACVHFAWYLGSEKDTRSLLYAWLTFPFVSLPSLTTPRCSVHFGHIGFQPAPHLPDPTTHPFLFASPQLTYVVTKGPRLLLFTVQAALQSFTAATRTPVVGKQSSFRNVSYFCCFLRLKTIFFIHAKYKHLNRFIKSIHWVIS